MKKVFITIVMGVFIHYTITDGKYENVRKLNLEINYKGSKFTDQLMKEYIDKVCLHPEIVYKQFILESGRGSSRLAREQNNYFGMKHARVRETKSIKDSCGHAYFNHWTESVEDYRMYQDYYEITDTCNYESKLLANNYSENTSYLNLIKTID